MNHTSPTNLFSVKSLFFKYSWLIQLQGNSLHPRLNRTHGQVRDSTMLFMINWICLTISSCCTSTYKNMCCCVHTGSGPDFCLFAETLDHFIPNPHPIGAWFLNSPQVVSSDQSIKTQTTYRNTGIQLLFLHIKWSQWRWFRNLIKMDPRKSGSGHFLPEGDCGVDPGNVEACITSFTGLMQTTVHIHTYGQFQIIN